MLSSGDLINSLTQRITDESNPPSPSKGMQIKLEEQDKRFREEAEQREVEFKEQLETLTKEFLESLDHKEKIITQLR